MQYVGTKFSSVMVGNYDLVPSTVFYLCTTDTEPISACPVSVAQIHFHFLEACCFLGSFTAEKWLFVTAPV